MRSTRPLLRPWLAGYRVAFQHARRSLQLVEEDLRLENQMIREEIETLRAEMAELRQMAGIPEPGQPLN
jgi:hypothetical protein